MWWCTVQLETILSADPLIQRGYLPMVEHHLGSFRNPKCNIPPLQIPAVTRYRIEDYPLPITHLALRYKSWGQVQKQ